VATRVKTRTVIFARPFFLDEVKRELPAGSYVVETDEETLDVSSFVAYRRVGTRLFVPAVVGQSETEMWVVSPQELDKALVRDRTRSNDTT
jgi:hypothetical protein